MIDKYGADANRFWYFGVGITGNQDVRFPGNKDKDGKWESSTLEQYKRFANKFWNAARFVMQNTGPLRGTKGDEAILTKDDKELLKDLDKIVKDTTVLMEKMDFAHAAENLYHYFWHTFADKVIEQAKPKLADKKLRASAQYTLHAILETSLKLLHPFMPFVTETIWQINHKKLLMVEKWPK